MSKEPTEGRFLTPARPVVSGKGEPWIVTRINRTVPMDLPAAEADAVEEMRPRDGFAGAPWSLRSLLERMILRHASDLYLCSGQAPRFRVDGEVVSSGQPAPEDRHMSALLVSLLSEQDRQEFEQTGDMDLSYEESGLARFRVNLFRHRGGLGAVFRPVPTLAPRLSELGLPAIMREFVHLDRGLMVLTGPTGSGKSTTAAALIMEMAETRPLHIMTVEDPIEFTLSSRKSLITQREVGVHASSFAHALRDALREDIDVLVVGEMRDTETVGLAVKAAETGLLVLGTLHTPSASRAVSRLLDMFPAEEQEQVRLMLADSLRAVVSQQLVRRADRTGRVPAVEVLTSSASLAHAIREGRISTIESMIQTGREGGMISMDQSLLDLYERALINADDALDCAHRVEFLTARGVTRRA